jgi:hypothetical protein
VLRLPAVVAPVRGWFDATAMTTLDLDRVGDVVEWRSRHTNTTPQFWKHSTRMPRYSSATNGVVFDQDVLETWSALAMPDQHYTIFLVVRWNAGAAAQSILRFYNVAEAFESGRIEAEGSKVRFSHRAKKGGPVDLVEGDFWPGSGPLRLVVVKRVPFLNGTSHAVGNGASTKIVPAMSTPFATNQHVTMGAASLDAAQPGSLYGTVHEVVWLGGALSSAEDKEVLEYLKVKWGL